MKQPAEKRGPDYTLNLFPALDDETKKPGILFVVQTTKVFVSFQYDILLECELQGRSIRLRIKGLHAPELLMPGGGPAFGKAHLTDLFGHYSLVVTKQDKSESMYDIDVANGDVTILRAPETTFIQVSTEKISL